MIQDNYEIFNRAHLNNSKVFWNEELRLLLNGSRNSFLRNITASTYVRNLVDQNKTNKLESEINFKKVLKEYVDNINENIFDIDLDSFLLTLDLIKYYKPQNAPVKLLAILNDFCSKIYESSLEDHEFFFQELIASINKYIVFDFKNLNRPDYSFINLNNFKEGESFESGLQVLFQDYLFRTLNSSIRKVLFSKTSISVYALIELINNNALNEVEEHYANHLISKINRRNFNLLITSFVNSKMDEKYREFWRYLLVDFNEKKKVESILKKRQVKVSCIENRVQLSYKNGKTLILNKAFRNEFIYASSKSEFTRTAVKDAFDISREGIGRRLFYEFKKRT